jgi:hypothetical protein
MRVLNRKHETKFYLILYPKVIAVRIKDPNVKNDTLNLLKGNI